MDIFLPPLCEWALGFIIGLSLMTIVFEIIAIFGLLTRPIVIMVFAIFLVVSHFISRRHQRSEHPYAGVAHPLLFRRSIRRFWQKEFHLNIYIPSSLPGIVSLGLALFLLALLIILNFYHSLLFPETYWDSLIYYIGYGRWTFLEHRFPVKVVAQVGIGLGANYPHLYPLTGSVIATFWGYWHDVFAQTLAPLSSLVTTVLVFYIILHFTRRLLMAVLVTLMFRSIPYAIAYFTYASDYSVAMAFTSGFLYLSLRYINERKRGYLILLCLLLGGATHLNYLMWFLWGGMALLIFLVHRKGEVVEEKYFTASSLSFSYESRVPPLKELISKRWFQRLIVATFILSSTWYVRNWIVTGNPFYAFFPSIFDGKNINPEVLDSCFNEWRLNGDGIGRLGHSLGKKILNTPTFLLYHSPGYYWSKLKALICGRSSPPSSGTLQWNHSWKLLPGFVGWALPGVLLAIISLFRKRQEEILSLRPRVIKNYLTVCLFLFGFLVFYHYVISDIYLYHIVPIFIPSAIFISLVYVRLWRGIFRAVMLALTLYIAVVPGLSMSLMGFKFKNVAEISGMRFSPIELVALRNPCMNKETFYRLEFGKDVDMWKFINKHLRGETILSHENRYLLYDPSIKFVHLDDLEIQSLYDLPVNERLKKLQQMGIHYYLYIPMEERHPITRRLGIKEWRENPAILKPIFRSGDNVLYKFVYKEEEKKE